MNKKSHSLILSGTFLIGLALAALFANWPPQSSIAQTLNQIAYLPAIVKGNSAPATPTSSPTRITPSATPVTPSPTSTSSPSTPVTPSHTPSPTPSRTPSPTPVVPSPTPIVPPPGMIYIDHNSVALFDQIPDEYIEAAANINMFYMDRSVGENINDGLSCMSQPWASAPYFCKIYNHPVPEFSVDISEVSWDGTYDRSNWVYEGWGNGCGTWSQKVECFMDRATQVMGQYEVLSFQFSYLEVDDGSTIADLPGGFFYNNSNLFDVYDQETFEAQHPNEIFIYWTSSLARGIGSLEAESFNEQMRQYAIDHDKILFDVADILSHTPEDENPCYDNRDGIPYSAPGQSENFPDDGLNTIALCQHYTSEADGGHLGSPSAGMIRVTKAYWVLMAQIAGWDPN